MIGAALPDWSTYLPVFLKGAGITLWLFATSLPLAFLFALPVAAGRLSPRRAAAFPAHAFILFFRGAPLLPILFLIYYGLPQVPGLRQSFLWPLLREPFPIAVAALALNSAAFQAEILAGARRGVPGGEVDAATAAGFSAAARLRFVILPHMLRIAAPAFGNECVFVLKATAVASFITLQDMMGAASAVYLRSFDPVVPLLVAGLFYLVVVGAVASLVRLVQNRTALPYEAALARKRASRSVRGAASIVSGGPSSTMRP